MVLMLIPLVMFLRLLLLLLHLKKTKGKKEELAERATGTLSRHQRCP